MLRRAHLVLSGALLWLACSSSLLAQSSARGNAQGGIENLPLKDVVAAVSARTGMVFVVDPRVNAQVTAPGMKLQELTFDDLQAILSVYGFTAVPVGSLYKIIPDEGARQAPVPVIIDGDRRVRPNDQFATRVLQPRKLAATSLVTALRPLLPKEATITANAATNSLIVVAAESDIKAVEVMMEKLEAAR